MLLFTLLDYKHTSEEPLRVALIWDGINSIEIWVFALYVASISWTPSVSYDPPIPTSSDS